MIGVLVTHLCTLDVALVARLVGSRLAQSLGAVVLVTVQSVHLLSHTCQLT